MRRIGLIFMGFLLLIAMLGLLFFSGAIYDAEKKHTIETYFFEPNTQYNRRVSMPVSADEMPNTFLRDVIISRFINEYFYVIPDSKNATMRTEEFRNTDRTRTALWGLSGRKSVYETWQKTVAPEIVELASNKALRTVQVLLPITESETGHLIVRYRLSTWKEPNNVLAGPDIQEGEVYLDVTKQPIRVEQTKEVLDNLEYGVDPVSAFSFEILGVVQN